MNDLQAQAMIENLEAIKKLLVLQTLDAGHTQDQVATALGIGRSSVSKMFPGGVPKKK
ncbi:helix-turn-helix domain-containing protein [Hellea sp.]|nr:helix-turn-helix domain-containing protein [Hellea sp.]